MNMIDLLLSRRSVVANNIGEPGPDKATLERILAAGIRVPDHGKLGPWRLQVLGKEGQVRLGDLFATLFRRDNPTARDRAVEMERARPQRAPVLIVVSNRIDRDHKVPAMEQFLSGGALCQNLLNAAHAAGFAAQWLTEWPAYHPQVKEALGIAPEHDIIGFVYIGTTRIPPSERERPGVADVVSTWP